MTSPSSPFTRRLRAYEELLQSRFRLDLRALETAELLAHSHQPWRLHGAMQQRPAIAAHGGTVTSPPFEIQTVGTLVMFEDSEGNTVGGMQYLDGMP